jgi:hypothetical protein
VVDVVLLADDGEVSTLAGQRGEELVDVAADAPAVGGDGGRIDDDARWVRQEELRGGRGGEGLPEPTRGGPETVADTLTECEASSWRAEAAPGSIRSPRRSASS